MSLVFVKRRLQRLFAIRISKPTAWVIFMTFTFCLNWALPFTSLLSIPVRPKRLRHDRLFCWILTSSGKHESRVPAVHETWPKRCDKALFYTDLPMNDTYPHAVVFNNITDGILNLWPKTKEAMRFTHNNYLQQFDWFFKVGLFSALHNVSV